MKKICLFALGMLCSLPVIADVNLEPLLNKVSLQLQAEQWVTTKTALVNINVNASVSGVGIEKIQNEVMQKLTQFSDKGEWHIVSFNRSQDQSGLESIQIVAQARLPQSELANLRDRAKSLSKPGETYTIDSVLFVPSEDEIRQANVALRANLYQQVKTEMDVLNKSYPDQKYYVHEIDFLSLPPPIQPMPIMEANAMMARNMRAPSAPMSVGNKVQVQANVVIASTPDVLNQKVALK